jgi:4-amino-4-deoxy-L-arabinose transferase-like glycosyltransferase
MSAEGTSSERAIRGAVVPFPREVLRVFVLSVLVFALAILPRTWGLADFYTIDEGYHWVGRVQEFSRAIAHRDWDETILTGHPGVTTMWLGSLGQTLAHSQGVEYPGWIGGGAAFLAYLRLPLALANSAAVALGFLMLRRLLPTPVPLLAALLWALNPFLIAHSRLLHLDALLTSLLTLSLLALLLACRSAAGAILPLSRAQEAERSRRGGGAGRPWRAGFAGLLASGGLAGLALVTKAPSLLWLPLAGLLLCALAPAGSLWARLGWAVGRYALWLACALLAAFVAWPALWVTPEAAVWRVAREIVNNGGQPHHSGNYFLGTPVADPGPLFYPVALALRLTPWALLGLLLLPLALRRAARPERATLLALGAFAACFVLALSMQPKKFDRYALPILPALDILAAAGLLALLGSLAHWTGRRRLPALGIALVTLLASLTLLIYQPYYLAYFNPLLGGGPAAQRAILVGWGEGMHEVGAWLSARPDLARGAIVSWTPPNLGPFVPREIPLYDLRPAVLARGGGNYAVLYLRSVQRKESAPAEAAVRQTPPLYTLERYGITYATVHQLVRPFATASPAEFGAGLRLNGYTLEQQPGQLILTPSWSVTADQPGGAFVFLHLLDAQGQRVAQLDAPLDEGMFATWQAGQQFGGPLPLAIRPDLPAGQYRLVLGVYDPATGARLPLGATAALPASVDGPQALLLETITR